MTQTKYTKIEIEQILSRMRISIVTLGLIISFISFIHQRSPNPNELLPHLPYLLDLLTTSDTVFVTLLMDIVRQ